MASAAKDAQPISAFKRDTAKVAARLKKTGKPLVLTVNGKAEMVVQDAEAYQRLQELAAQAERAEMKAFLDESMEDIKNGNTVPAREFLESLKKMKL